MTGLPGGWEMAPLSEVCLPVIKIDPVAAGRTTIRYIDIGSVDGDRHKLMEIPTLEAVAAPTRARQVVQAGDTVFSTVRPYLEKIAHVDATLDGEFASTGFCVLRPGIRLDHRWLYHYATSRGLLDQVLPHQRGVSYPAVLNKDVLHARIPLPPLEEQRRVVALLEDLLSRLDAATAGVQRAQRRLGRLEQSVLSDGYQAGDLWPLGNLAAIQGGIQKQPKRAPAANAFPFLRVANVTARGLELEDVHHVELFDGELDKFRLRAGDLLVVEGNGSPSQIGRAALWNGEIEDCVHQNHLIRVRPSSEVEPAYLEAIWNAPQNRRQLTALSSSSSGLHTLSVAKLKSLKIPVAEPPAQREAVARVGEIRAVRQRLQADLVASVARGLQLRRALLKAAFSGALHGHQLLAQEGSHV